MKKIIIAAGLVLAAASLLLSGWIGYSDWQNDRRMYEKSARQQISQLAAELPEQPQEYGAFMENYERQEEIVALIDADQNLVAQNKQGFDYQPGKEVSQAWTAGYGFDVRRNRQDGQFYYYAAGTQLVQGNNIAICLAVPSGKWSYISERAAAALIVCLAGQGAALLMIYVYFQRKVSRPLKQLNDAIKQASEGKRGKEIFMREQQAEVEELARSFQTMNSVLTNSLNELGEQNSQLYAMLDSLTEAVVAVDLHSRILLTNHAAYAMLGIAPGCAGKMLLETVHSEALGELLDAAREGNGTDAKELRLRPDSGQLLRVQISPIVGAAGNCIGEMIVAEDVTQMRQLEKIRYEFASNVSHELKTPLTSIIGFVDALREGALEDPKVARRFIDIIGKESDRLYRLIQDILLLSSIERSSADMDMQWVDVNELAKQVGDLLQDAANKKGITFSVETDDGVPRFFCNRDRIFQLWLNLCDNAVKYTEKGRVRAAVEYQADQNQLCFTVSDTGIGIPREACERIFERFYRVDKGRSRNMGGTGLGLSIVKHIVLLYGGTISVDSQPGRGTTFKVKLPYFRGEHSARIEKESSDRAIFGER